MNKILILFAHPRFEKSKTNRALLKNIEKRQDVTLNDLYEQYPDFNIDVDREKELLVASKEGKKGNAISQSEMDQKVEEWLSER